MVVSTPGRKEQVGEGILNELTPEGGWNGPAAPRVRPLEMHELTLTQRVLLEVMLKVGTANCPHVFRTLFRNLRLYLPFSRFTAKMMPKGRTWGDCRSRQACRFPDAGRPRNMTV